jgi:lysophospholipase L1-like esterase
MTDERDPEPRRPRTARAPVRRATACVIAAVALLAGACGHSGPKSPPPAAQPQATATQAPPAQSPPTQPPAAPPAAAPPPGRTALVVIGDSLSVGTAPILPALLPGWQVRTDGLGGRPLAEGMRILAGAELPADGSTVLAFSLFTNDDPSHTQELETAVRQSLARAGPRGCAIWATIVRPPIDGVPYDGANAVLRRLAAADARMRLVDWAQLIATQPALMGPDGIHPTPQGYQARAQMYADAARSCGPAQSS